MKSYLCRNNNKVSNFLTKLFGHKNGQIILRAIFWLSLDEFIIKVILKKDMYKDDKWYKRIIK